MQFHIDWEDFCMHASNSQKFNFRAHKFYIYVSYVIIKNFSLILSSTLTLHYSLKCLLPKEYIHVSVLGIHYLSHTNINFVLIKDRCLCLLVQHTNIDISLNMTRTKYLGIVSYHTTYYINKICVFYAYTM